MNEYLLFEKPVTVNPLLGRKEKVENFSQFGFGIEGWIGASVSGRAEGEQSRGLTHVLSRKYHETLAVVLPSQVNMSKINTSRFKYFRSRPSGQINVCSGQLNFKLAYTAS